VCVLPYMCLCGVCVSVCMCVVVWVCMCVYSGMGVCVYVCVLACVSIPFLRGRHAMLKIPSSKTI